MITWFRQHNRQLLIGLALVVLPVVYFTYSGVSWSPLNPHDHLIQNSLAYVFLILFSYVNHTVFVPRWFLTKQYRRYVLVVIGCVLATAYMPYRIEQWAFFKPPRQHTPVAWLRQVFVEEMMLEPPSWKQPSWKQPSWKRPSWNRPARQRFDDPRPSVRSEGAHQLPGRPRSRFVTGRPPNTLFLPVKLAILFLLGSLSTLLSISVQTASRLRQIENDQLQAELRQLRAQIQPHFLFNTLNSIYALAIRNDSRTADAIIRLSEFMRYTIRDAHREKVPLRNEIGYIANYINLQKARLRDAVQVDYRLDGEPGRLQIAPLLLFSFIENAFKYGVNPEEDSLIVIHLRIQDDQLAMDVVNNKVQVSQFDESTGIGLKNTRDRLRLLYPNAHQLRVNDTPARFQVSLRMTLS